MTEGIDQISTLPDVLTHILSFLSAREAVRTCILSKRWRNTWTYVPVLNFDFNEFQTFSDTDVLKFERFVSSMFKNRGPSHLDTVIFRGFPGRECCELLLGWLDCAALLMPRVISADIPPCYLELSLPDSVFSCASLENLELCHHPASERVNIIQNSIALASLKTLSLGCLLLEDDFTQKLLLGCPALENLKLYDCDLYVSDISSNVLKKLTLVTCLFCQHMRICCPILVSLSIKSDENINGIISLENMASLARASIESLGNDETVEDLDMEDLDDLKNLKFLSGLSNATTLKLYFDDHIELKELWGQIFSNCPIFYNLKSLEIGAWNMINDFSMVACFLLHCPVLKQLTLHLDELPDVILETRRDVSFQHEYLDTVNISCRKTWLDKKADLAAEMVTVLRRHVKTIGNIYIMEY